MLFTRLLYFCRNGNGHVVTEAHLIICMRRREGRRSCLTSSHAATMNNKLKYLIKMLGAEPHKNHSSGKYKLSEIRHGSHFPWNFMWLRTAWKKISRRNITVMRQISDTWCVLDVMRGNQILDYVLCRNQDHSGIRTYAEFIRDKSTVIIQT